MSFFSPKDLKLSGKILVEVGYFRIVAVAINNLPCKVLFVVFQFILNIPATAYRSHRFFDASPCAGSGSVTSGDQLPVRHSFAADAGDNGQDPVDDINFTVTLIQPECSLIDIPLQVLDGKMMPRSGNRAFQNCPDTFEACWYAPVR